MSGFTGLRLTNEYCDENDALQHLQCQMLHAQFYLHNVLLLTPVLLPSLLRPPLLRGIAYKTLKIPH